MWILDSGPSQVIDLIFCGCGVVCGLLINQYGVSARFNFSHIVFMHNSDVIRISSGGLLGVLL